MPPRATSTRAISPRCCPSRRTRRPPPSGAEVLALETELARMQWTPVQSRDRRAMHNPIKTTDLESRYAGFEWPFWLRGLGVEAPAVIVNQVSYVEALAKLTTSIPVPRWKAYLKAALLDRYAPYLSRAFVDAEFSFRGTTLGGRKANLPRWRRAIEAINASMGHVMAQAYVERHFPAGLARPHVAPDREPARGAGRSDRRGGLDVRAHQARSARKAPGVPRQHRLPAEMARFRRSGRARRRPRGKHDARRPVRAELPARARRRPVGPGGVDDAAAGGERAVLSAAQRDHVSRPGSSSRRSSTSPPTTP